MTKPTSDARILRRLFLQARPYWPHLTGVFLLNLLATPLVLLNPLPIKIVVDSVLGTQPLPQILEPFVPAFVSLSTFRLLCFATALQVAIVVLAQLQHLANKVLSTYTGEKLVLNFRARLFSHMQRLSFSFHDTRGSADTLYRIQWDTPSIQNLMLGGLLPFVSSGVTLVSMVYVTLRLDWRLALIALTVSPVLITAARAYKTRMRPKYKQQKRMATSALNVLHETLGAVRVVQAFGREEAENERFVDHSTRSVRSKINLAVAAGMFGLGINLVTALSMAAVLFVGVRSVQNGVLSLGELLMVLAYLGQLYGPLKTVSTKVGTIQNAMASAERAFELLDEVPDVIEKPNALGLARAQGHVSFSNVSFAYEANRPVLRDISFDVPGGTRVGIAGRTGSGKTTMVNLLTRFYDPTSGRILLDGVDLPDYRLMDLRNQFAIVLQESVLFSSTIAENISYARPDADDKAIIAAARAANAHDFIVGLPEGYDTLVGERGMRLSGGERQRISLARAFLKDAPILILDEPTSSVDMHTEAGIMEAMERLMKGRTTFMIAHRLSTLDNSDVVLTLEEGELIGERQVDLSVG